MNFGRLALVHRVDFSQTFKRPLFLVLLVILGLTAWGLAGGNMRIASGDANVGGTKAWLTSEFAMAQMLSMVIFIFYMFFIAIAAGMTIIRDDEQKVGEILHSTPLSPREYVWGKFTAVMLAFFVVLAIHTLFSVFFNHVLPNANAAEIRGPLNWLNYIRPALVFGVPTLFFFAGTAFLMGALTRRPILVFVLPVALLLFCAFFLWDWSPSWLDPRVNRILMMVEPAGFRWLNETWLKVDQGVEFYNTAPIGYDTPFLLSRLAFVAIGLICVEIVRARFERNLRGAESRKRTVTQFEAPSFDVATPASWAADPAALQGRRRPVGFWGGALTVARFELAELKSSAGLYLFVPIILIQIIGNSYFNVGPFDTPVLLTSGYLAVSHMNTLTLLVCLLILFYTVESMQRERNTGVAPIAYATPVRTISMLFGKALANTVVGGVILFASLVSCLIIVAVQGRVPVTITPFLVTWGLILVPTFLAWSAFVMAVQALTGNRYATYALGLGALILTGYKQMTGQMNWVGNWDAWGVVRWSDLGIFELNRFPLALNRLMVLGLLVFFVVLAVRLFDRKQRDATRMLHRLRPGSLLRAALGLLPVAAAPIAIGIFLYVQVQAGFQSDAAELQQKNYWRANISTWKDAPLPAITHADVELDLVPSDRFLSVEGFFDFLNHLDDPLPKIPLTMAAHWDSVSWTLDGEPFEPENRSGLYVFTPKEPLAPGDRVRIGWSCSGRAPDGATKNGGGVGEYVLPMGVVLTSFSGSFTPVLGYSPDVGVDEDNRSDPREYPDDFHAGITSTDFGSDIPFTTRVRITGPEEYAYHSVGTRVDEGVSDGRRTVTWESDHPVTFFNVVAGRWEESVGEGTAIYYHPDHAYNVPEMQEGLDAARRYYSEWFYPYPWQELKVSEFANLASYAQGFATNITFSEGIGFLTKSDPRANTAFMVIAHEAAHQWWGNIITPGKGPGGNILSEGMAHFSTMLLFDQVKGDEQRMSFAKVIENRYGENRQVDSERPLVRVDGSKPGDTTVTYDKGGWVAYMLMNAMGRERALGGVRDFIERYRLGPDHPVLYDFVDVMREHAADPAAFDAFADQWFFDVVVPEYRLSEADVREIDGAWEVTCRVENKGSGRMPVEIAAARGERFPDPEEEEEAERESDQLTASTEVTPVAGEIGYLDARTIVELGAGESAEVSIRCSFEPERLVVDPDVQVLQLNRERAQTEL